MKDIQIDLSASKNAKNIYSDGDFTFEMIPDFVQFPNPDWEFEYVGSGCCSADGILYVFMRDAKSRIAKYDAETGAYIGDIQTGLIKGLHFGCVTPENTLILVDVPNHCAVEMTLEGEEIQVFGERGKASDSGRDNLYWKRERRYGKQFPTEIECYFTSEKWEFHEAGKRISHRAEPFNMPTSVVCGNNGEIYFGDGYGNCAVHCFTRDGKLVSSWGDTVNGPNGTYTPGPGKFLFVHGVAVDSQDRVWANDRENNAVNVFDKEGNVVAYLHGNLGQPSDLFFDGEFMYVVGRAGYMTIFDMDFNIKAQLGYFNSDIKAHGISGNSNGDIFLFPTKANPDHQVIKLKRIK